jgi:hypothetical protein
VPVGSPLEQPTERAGGSKRPQSDAGGCSAVSASVGSPREQPAAGPAKSARGLTPAEQEQAEKKKEEAAVAAQVTASAVSWQEATQANDPVAVVAAVTAMMQAISDKTGLERDTKHDRKMGTMKKEIMQEVAAKVQDLDKGIRHVDEKEEQTRVVVREMKRVQDAHVVELAALKKEVKDAKQTRAASAPPGGRGGMGGLAPPSAVMVRGWISRQSREIRDRDQRRAAMEADAITDEQVEEFLAKAKTVPELTDRVDWAASLDRSTRWTAVYTIFLILKEASVQAAVAVKRGSPR